MVFAENDSAFQTQGESKMMPHLVDWLRRSRWLREDSLLVREFPIHGRRADLVTMTRSGVISSFELKLGGFGRVLEQAVYNKYSVDRSWMVLGSTPRAQNLQEAQRFGVGIIVVRDSIPRVVLRPGGRDCDKQARIRVEAKLVGIGESSV